MCEVTHLRTIRPFNTNPFPHTTTLQQTTFESNEAKTSESIASKGEISFKKKMAADA